MTATVRKLLREVVRFADATRAFGHPIAVAQRYRHLYFERRFSPNEIRFFGLLDPALQPRDLERFTSKEELLAVQRALNPRELHDRTEDKLEFHRRCLAAGVNVPRLVAVLAPNGCSPMSAPVVGRPRDLVVLLDSLDERSLILKPVRGVHGEGVTRLQRAAHGWTDADGARFTAGHLERVVSRSGYDEWMLQETVVGHPVLAAFSDTDALQTCRIVTLLDARGRAEILAARLRLVCGPGTRDNFSYGQTGNVIANLDPVTGAIVSAVGGAGRDPRIVPVDAHPRTGRVLSGFRVPEWPAAAQLALRAAKSFAPLRTVGWDVAIGRDSICVIEGNVTWDTLSGEPRMGELYRRLRAECGSSAAEAERREPGGAAPANDDAVQQHQ